MKSFADLYAALDETTKTNEKVEALTRYFSRVPPADAAWAATFLIGRRPKRLLESRKLGQWAIEEAGIPDWLFCGGYHAVGGLAGTLPRLLGSGTRAQWAIEESDIPDWLFGECYHAVGDFAETIALLLPPAQSSTNLPLHHWIEERLLTLRDADDEARRASLVSAWCEMDERQRFAWNKIITGEFRVGVSQSLVVRAVAAVSGLDAAVVSHRLMGDWQPTAAFWTELVTPDARDADVSRPYPFFLAYPLEGAIEELGGIREWQVEGKWDGIRAQLIRRSGRTFVWSRGEELMTDRFPELAALGAQLPEGLVVDGEVLPWKNGEPLPFAQLQRRIGRKLLGPRILSEVPVVIVAYDLLELHGEDIRERPLEFRRAHLEEIAPPDSALIVSPVVLTDTWEELTVRREEARARKVEGLMLKRLGSPYRVGRRPRKSAAYGNRASAE